MNSSFSCDGRWDTTEQTYILGATTIQAKTATPAMGHGSIWQQLRAWAKKLKRDGVTLWFASRHPGTPWYAKTLAVSVVAYALSPIDLIPDFIPILGYVDEVILLPGLIWLALRLVPVSVLEECRGKADEWMRTKGAKPTSAVGAVVVVAIWVAVSYTLWRWFTGDS